MKAQENIEHLEKLENLLRTIDISKEAFLTIAKIRLLEWGLEPGDSLFDNTMKDAEEFWDKTKAALGESE